MTSAARPASAVGKDDAWMPAPDGERRKGDGQDEHLVRHRDRRVSPHPLSRPERNSVTLRQEQRRVGEKRRTRARSCGAISERQCDEPDRNRGDG